VSLALTPRTSCRSASGPINLSCCSSKKRTASWRRSYIWSTLSLERGARRDQLKVSSISQCWGGNGGAHDMLGDFVSGQLEELPAALVSILQQGFEFEKGALRFSRELHCWRQVASQRCQTRVSAREAYDLSSRERVRLLQR
jgi:hypothetical protein